MNDIKKKLIELEKTVYNLSLMMLRLELKILSIQDKNLKPTKERRSLEKFIQINERYENEEDE